MMKRKKNPCCQQVLKLNNMARYKSNHAYFELYFKYYSNFQLGSVFLNSGKNIQIGVDTKFWDEQNLRNELVHYTGNERGVYKKDGDEILALIPFAKSELNDLEENNKRYVQKQKNLGFEITEYPSNVLDRKLKLEALLDVMQMEKEFIEKRLSTFVEKVEVVDDSKVLAWGLCGMVKQINNQVHMIDGQLVKIIDGVNCISDPRSVFDGLSLLNYRKLCAVWREGQKRKNKEKLILAQAECRERGIPVVSHIGATSFKRVSKSNLPPFPEGCINHKIIKKEEDSLTRPLKRNQ